MCCLPACVPPPGSPSVPQIEVAGEWTGTFESSWGTLPVRFTLVTERYATNISGSYTVDGQRAAGTLGGVIETRQKDEPAMFYGSLTISYLQSGGESCRSTSGVSVGAAFPQSASIITDGFPSGNCQDPPTNVRMTLSR